MGPEKEKREQKNIDDKPLAEPHREDQKGLGQANQSLWEGGKEGKAIAPPPDAVPKQDPNRKK